MKTKLIAVYDKKTALFDNPFTVRHVGDAIREWDIVRKIQKLNSAKIQKTSTYSRSVNMMMKLVHLLP